VSKDKIGKFENYKLFAKKPSGHQEGGVYKLRPEFVMPGEDPDTLYFVKKMDLEETVSEYVGSNIARLLLGESAPQVQLLRDQTGKVYTASRAIENFKTAKEHISDAGIPQDCWPNGCIIDENGDMLSVQSYMLGWVEYNQPKVQRFKDAEKISLTARFLEHGDMHMANLGVRQKENVQIAAVIDFSWSLGDKVELKPYELPPGSNDKVIGTFEAILERKKEIIALAEMLLAKAKEVYSASEIQALGTKNMLLRKLSAIEREVTLTRLTSALDKEHIFLIKKFSKGIKDVSIFKDVNEHTINNLINSIIKSGNKVLFIKMLPYIETTSSAMKKAFESAVVNNKIPVFNKLLPLIGEDTGAMEKALAEAVKHKRVEMFDAMLTYMSSDPFAIEQAFIATVRINRKAMFDKILPYIRPDSDGMQQAILEAVKSDRTEMLGKMLTDSESISLVLDSVVELAIKSHKLNNPTFRRLLIDAVTKAGKLEMLDTIHKNSAIDILVYSPTPLTEPAGTATIPHLIGDQNAKVPKLPAGPEPVTVQSHDAGFTPRYPDLNSTLMLAQLLLGLKTHSAPAKVEMPPFIEQPARQNEPTENLPSTILTGADLAFTEPPKTKQKGKSIKPKKKDRFHDTTPGGEFTRQ